LSAPSRVPVVTLLLIVANLIAAFAVAYNPEWVMDYGFNSKSPSFLTTFTCLFVHQNLFHLLGNMVFLAAVGAAVELATGSARFSLVYFVSGFFGVLAHFLLTMTMREPQILLGASGCIAGCAAYYSVRYTRLRVPVAPRRGITVATVTMIWIGLQIVGAFVHVGESNSVSFWAHIGGFVGGLLLSLIFHAPDLGRLKLGHEVLDQMNERGPAAMALAARQHLNEHPGDIRALKEIADAERQMGHADQECAALLELLEALPESEQADTIERISNLGRLSSLPSLRRTLLADRFQSSAPHISRALLVSVVDGPESDTQVPDAMLALAALEREIEPERATEILARLQKSFPLHPTVELARHRGWIP
jgi:membrane associated rhomboid family serine protease